MHSADIDFVILWVDGDDPRWKAERDKYVRGHYEKEYRYRFRDWDTLRYLFRAFEAFTPWVRKIHFVTWGHLPEWLDRSHPKLHIVYHEAYIEQKYLPVFNANPLEINLHRIDGLSDQFIFFNDDTFITSPLPSERFFKNGLPCDMFVLNALSSSSGVGHFVLNDLEIINRHFDKKSVMRHTVPKWMNLIYGGKLLRNIVLVPWPRFTGFVDPHQPQPFLKSTYEEVWSKEKETLEKTSTSRFRNCGDINQYLFRYWQLAQGKFEPISMKDTKYIELNLNDLRSGKIAEVLGSDMYAMVCLNDSEDIKTEEEFEEAKQLVQNALEKILPDKSGFEKR